MKKGKFKDRYVLGVGFNPIVHDGDRVILYKRRSRGVASTILSMPMNVEGKFRLILERIKGKR